MIAFFLCPQSNIYRSAPGDVTLSLVDFWCVGVGWPVLSGYSLYCFQAIPTTVQHHQPEAPPKRQVMRGGRGRGGFGGQESAFKLDILNLIFFLFKI